MDYYTDCSLSNKLENLYNTNLITRSFTALFCNLLHGRRKYLLDQILRLYRKKTLLKRGFSALKENIQLKKYFYAIADRQLIGNFLLRWHSLFQGRSSIRKFKSNNDRALLRRCFRILYKPVVIKSRWGNIIGRLESLLYYLNARSFIFEFTYSKGRENVEFIAKSHYKSKMLKKIFSAFTKNFEYNYRIESVEQILVRCLCHNFFVNLLNINIILERDNINVKLFKKRLVFNAWRSVVLGDIAENFHDIYMSRSYFHYWRVTATRFHQLRVRYESFVKRVDLNIASSVFTKITKVMQRKESLVYYLNYLESISRRIAMRIVFENLRFSFNTAEKLKLMVKTSEVMYLSSLKSKSMNSFISYVSISIKKRRLREIGEVWNANSLKSKYFYRWKAEVTESNVIHSKLVDDFRESMLNGIKRLYFIHWVKFSSKMSSLRYNANEFIPRDREIFMNHYWGLWVKNYIINKQKSLELFVNSDIFDGFSRVIALYPRQILLIFSSPCTEAVKSSVSTIGNKNLSMLVESLEMPLPSIYDKFVSCNVTCLYHDTPRYSCLLTIPKWKNKLIYYNVKRFKHSLQSWRMYVSNKLSQKKKLQILVDFIHKNRNRRLISSTFYAWVELMAACYAKQREQYLDLVGKLCSSIEKPITREIKYFFTELRLFKYSDNHHNNLLRKSFESFRKHLLLKSLYSRVNTIHDNNLLKSVFTTWMSCIVQNKAKYENSIKIAIESSIKRRYLNYIKLAISVTKFTRLHDMNLVKSYYNSWNNLHNATRFERQIMNRLMVRIIEVWRTSARMESDIKVMESKIGAKYEKVLATKSFGSWLTFTRNKNRLNAVSGEITHKNNINLLRFVFSAWLNRNILIKKVQSFAEMRDEKYSRYLASFVIVHLQRSVKLSKIKGNLILGYFYGLWKNALKSIKILNRFELVLSIIESRGFIHRLKEFNVWYASIQISRDNIVYKSLYSLADISRWRMEFGLQSLALNVKVKRLLSRCFKIMHNNHLTNNIVRNFGDKIIARIKQEYFRVWVDRYNHRLSITHKVELIIDNQNKELLKGYFTSWRKCTVDEDFKYRVRNVEIWSNRRRAAEGFRRLKQFTMDKKWETICNHQASIFKAIRDVARVICNNIDKKGVQCLERLYKLHFTITN